jgi:hypothetical protein
VRDTLTVTDAWICRSVSIVRLRIEDDRPVFLGFASGSAASAIGGLDLIGPDTVTALRVICDGMMTYVSGRLRLDMASTATLLIGTAPDRQDLDDRLCDLAVDLVRPGGYDELRAAGRRSPEWRIRCNASGRGPARSTR